MAAVAAQVVDKLPVPEVAEVVVQAAPQWEDRLLHPPEPRVVQPCWPVVVQASTWPLLLAQVDPLAVPQQPPQVVRLVVVAGVVVEPHLLLPVVQAVAR